VGFFYFFTELVEVEEELPADLAKLISEFETGLEE